MLRCDNDAYATGHLSPATRTYARQKIKVYPTMNDPFARSSQSLTDALLNLDHTISLAEANVTAALQVGLPEAQMLSIQLPQLTLRARQFRASVPDMSQPPRWGEARRLLDQAAAFGPAFAPYLQLGERVTSAKKMQAEQAARQRAAAEAAKRAQQEQAATEGVNLARQRLSTLRQTVADMQLQRGPGFDDPGWLDAVRSVSSILAAQQVRMAGALANLRDGAFEDAQTQADQTLGESQAALDLAQRARSAAVARGTSAGSTTASMPVLTTGAGAPQPDQPAISVAAPLQVPSSGALLPERPLTLSLIEPRSGMKLRVRGTSTIVGRGQDPSAPPIDEYLDISRAGDPGEAEELGVSRRHAEIAHTPTGFMVRDLGSTNGTRIRHLNQMVWSALPPRQWEQLREGDALQLGLLELNVSIS